MGATVALSKYGIRPKFNQLKNYKPFIAQYGKLIEQAQATMLLGDSKGAMPLLSF